MLANKYKLIFISAIVFSVLSGPLLAYSVVEPIAQHCIHKDKLFTHSSETTPIAMNVMLGWLTSKGTCAINEANNIEILNIADQDELCLDEKALEATNHVYNCAVTQFTDLNDQQINTEQFKLLRSNKTLHYVSSKPFSATVNIH